MKRGARLGQHFLHAPWAAEKLAASLHLKPNTTVVEIGPGHGALTTHLLATQARVIAVEKDELLVAELSETFTADINAGRLEIRQADIRDIDTASFPSDYTVAANIPYYITGEIIRMFLETSNQPQAMALLIQKEVAERICTQSKESILSLSVKVYGTPSIVAKVPRGCFSPPPSVDSAILHIDAISRARFEGITESAFFGALHAGFAAKRKLLVNNLAKQYGTIDVSTCNIAHNARAEDISLDGWLCITRSLNVPASA